MEIGVIIAFNLKRIREEHNLSLGQLAEQAGVSKVILSKIERGDANPTINTILKITGALGLPYTSLLEMPAAPTKHIKKSDISEQIDGGFHSFNYYAKNQDRNFELFEIEMDPRCERRAIGHAPGSYEYILVTEGRIVLETEGEEYHLEMEDAVYFDASKNHLYRNETDQTVKMLMLISYS